MGSPRRSLMALDLAARLLSQDVQEDDGGLIAYAERLARRREGARALPMRHLAPLAASYERAERAYRAQGSVAPVFEAHHAPVQHGKTTNIQAAVLRTLRRNPKAWIAYPAYNSTTAEAKMYEVRQLAPGEGIRIDPNFDTSEEWRTKEGGGVVCGGIVGGPWTSRGFDFIFVDDPYKTAQDAYSAAWRRNVEAAFWTALWTRRRPWTSIIVNAARWHPNDLTGVLRKSGWPYLRLQAIDDTTGEALWPERWPLSELLAIRDGRPANEHSAEIAAVPRAIWASLYQGNPRPDDGKVFDPAHLLTYDALPPSHYPYREVMGIDLAYGARARHDRSALVKGRTYSHIPRSIYIVETWVGHEPVELFACRVAASQLARPDGPRLVLPRSADEIERTWRPQLAAVKGARRVSCRWGTSTTEAGTAGLMSGYGAQVTAVRAPVDKLARAQAGGYTSAWSEGRILVLASGGPQLDAWLLAHEDFTGADGDADDPIDASVAMHDEMGLPAPASLGGGGVRVGGDWGYSGAREC